MASKLVETAWTHKKKILFFGALGGWGLSYLNQLNDEQILRSSFARKAEHAGSKLIGSFGGNDYVPTKLHVFIDRSDSIYHKNMASFNKNVMPLLELAGFDVRIHNAENEEELRLLSKAADVRNCGGVVLVGSQKYAAPAVLDGLFVNNTSEARTSLAVFDPVDRDDVRARCQKAMRIINGHRDLQHVYSTKVYTADEEKTPSVLRIADINFGWFDFCREKEPKFWWFAGLSNRIAFTWYFLKSYPQPLPINAKIVKHCTGCRRCVSMKDQHEDGRRWWHMWVGRVEQPGDKKRRQYSNLTNVNCGKVEELEMSPVEIMISNLNKGEHGGLQLRAIDSFPSRWSAVWRVWSEWNDKKSPSNFFANKTDAQSIELKLAGELPAQVSETRSVKNLAGHKEEAKVSRILIETLPNTVQMY